MMRITRTILIIILFLLHFSGISSKPVDVPGSSPIVVIDADGDSGLTASVDSKLLSFLPCQGCIIFYHTSFVRTALINCTVQKFKLIIITSGVMILMNRVLLFSRACQITAEKYLAIIIIKGLMVQAANDFVLAKKRLGKIIVSFIDLSIHFNFQ